MSILDELIEKCENLSNTLEKAALDEKAFCTDVCMDFERQSWEMYRLKNSIKELKEIYGG